MADGRAQFRGPRPSTLSQRPSVIGHRSTDPTAQGAELVSRGPTAPSARHLRALFDAGASTGLTDGQLLERFATRRGESAELAFAALVERHGPMVLRACRGILNDDHEAMDAFQATFLVLVRKAG